MINIALDIGGTKTIAALTDENGKILVQQRFSTSSIPCESHLDVCISVIRELMNERKLVACDIHGIGVTLPGIVDADHGILIYAPFEKWENVPVAAYLEQSLGIPYIRCENDVNACAIGELKFGLGSKYSDFVWITVSTGVGGASVSGGKLIRGAEGFAGELGHLKVEYDHPVLCPCGQYGCLEAHGSGTAFNRLASQLAERDLDFASSLSAKGLKPDGKGCDVLAYAGNLKALQIHNEIGTYIGRGISYCINVLNPQAVILGGGVSASLELLRPSIQAAIKDCAFQKMQNVDILCTPLGYEAALRGAAALVTD